MLKKLKDNIYIEDFENKSELGFKQFCLAFNNYFNLNNIIYSGKINEITEDIAKSCVDIFSETEPILYVNYKNDYYIEKQFETAKESILSFCDKEYCIIYKK